MFKLFKTRLAGCFLTACFSGPVDDEPKHIYVVSAFQMTDVNASLTNRQAHNVHALNMQWCMLGAW